MRTADLTGRAAEGITPDPTSVRQPVTTVGKYASLARLLDGRRLRALALAVRREVDAAAPVTADREPDPAVVALVEEPYDSVADAVDRLDALADAFRERDDRRAVFATVYATMTAAVRRRIERGGFRDPAWVRDYTVTFADYYRRALLAFERGDHRRVPDPWRIAFDTAVAGEALVLQDAALGINAHINYDLALAVHEVGIGADRADRHADHRAIDAVLARVVDAQQRALAALYAPGVDDVDALLGRVDESLTLFGLEEGRAQAWRVAVVLTDFDAGPVERYARWVLRATAVGGALFVLAPALDGPTMAALEAVEREQFDVGETVGRLRARLDGAVPE